ncbi:MAG: PIN domain-containing protein [Coriobacteriia bacterium]|nr:PIN domain-containing protein [Coriobacteriia bacterium]
MLVDTDLIIWHLRGNKRAAKLLTEIAPFDISAITWAELVQGTQDKASLKDLKGLMQAWNVGIIHIDETISARALMLVTDYWLSHSLGFADAAIAATAIDQQLTLLTANQKHYHFIPLLEMETFKVH